MAKTPRGRRYNSSGNGSGGCFIATATMGSYEHPTVLELRKFRDEYLSSRRWGRSFIVSYYKYSPCFARIIGEYNILRKVSYVLIIKPLTFIARYLN